RFQAFAERFLGQYETRLPVVVKPPNGKVWPDVPGDDFPDPAGLPLGPLSCGRAIDERKAAWSRFAALEQRLGGVPVSAGSTIEFARHLMAAQQDKVYRSRGVTWVSPRVGHLAGLEGFCAVERKDWPEAMRTLARAAAIMPGNP